MISTRRLAAAVCGALLVSTAALAADNIVVLEGLDGDVPNSPRTIEVQSWSWGVSNSGTAAPRGAGKVNVQDLSMTKAVPPRDVASGLPTGKRTAVATDAAVATSAPADVAAVSDVTVTMPEASAKSACATGTHIKTVKLTARGQTVQLDDVVVTSCTSSAGVSTLAMRGHQKTGHVTLMK